MEGSGDTGFSGFKQIRARLGTLFGDPVYHCYQGSILHFQCLKRLTANQQNLDRVETKLGRSLQDFRLEGRERAVWWVAVNWVGEFREESLEHRGAFVNPPKP